MSRINVVATYVRNWVFEGEFIEDTQYFDTVYLVLADLEDGRTVCHNVSFNDRDEPRGSNEARNRACKLAEAVERAGSIDEEHWYFHDFFSHSLERRLEIEDAQGNVCSIQESSSAMEARIWLGSNKIGLQHFKAGQGWRSVTEPDEVHSLKELYVANNRMELNQKQVAALLPQLIHFVAHGTLDYGEDE
jgi:hypothetical protein